MSTRRTRQRENKLSGVVFGFAVLLAVASVVQLARAPSQADRTDDVSAAGRTVEADAGQLGVPTVAGAAALDGSAQVAAYPTDWGLAAVAAAEDRPSVQSAALPQAGLDSPPDSAGTAKQEDTWQQEVVFDSAPGDSDANTPEPLIMAPTEAVPTVGEAGPAFDAIAPEPLALVPTARTADLAPEVLLAPAEDAVLDTLEPSAGQATLPALDVGSVLSSLRQRGYGRFTSVAQQGNHYVFKALKGGRAVQVTVDAGTGAVLSVE